MVTLVCFVLVFVLFCFCFFVGAWRRQNALGCPKTNTKMADFCHSFPSDGGEGRASKGMGENAPHAPGVQPLALLCAPTSWNAQCRQTPLAHNPVYNVLCTKARQITVNNFRHQGLQNLNTKTQQEDNYKRVKIIYTWPKKHILSFGNVVFNPWKHVLGPLGRLWHSTVRILSLTNCINGL